LTKHKQIDTQPKLGHMNQYQYISADSSS